VTGMQRTVVPAKVGLSRHRVSSAWESWAEVSRSAVNVQASRWAGSFCKSVGVCLRRFESCTCHPSKRAVGQHVCVGGSLACTRVGYTFRLLPGVLSAMRSSRLLTWANTHVGSCQAFGCEEYVRKLPLQSAPPSPDCCVDVAFRRGGGIERRRRETPLLYTGACRGARCQGPGETAQGRVMKPAR
jgi:hypothetical protein